MTAVLRYEVDAVTQNGNHEVAVVPNDLPAMPGSLVHPVKPRAATVAYEGARAHFICHLRVFDCAFTDSTEATGPLVLCV